MILADVANTCPNYHLCVNDYLQTQFSPAHLLSELGFTLVFDLLLIPIAIFIFKRWIKPLITSSIHAEIDAEHNIEHHENHIHPAGPDESCSNTPLPYRIKPNEWETDE